MLSQLFALGMRGEPGEPLAHILWKPRQTVGAFTIAGYVPCAIRNRKKGLKVQANFGQLDGVGFDFIFRYHCTLLNYALPFAINVRRMYGPGARPPPRRQRSSRRFHGAPASATRRLNSPRISHVRVLARNPTSSEEKRSMMDCALALFSLACSSIASRAASWAAAFPVTA